MVNEWVAEMCKVAPVFVGHTMQYSNYSGEMDYSAVASPCYVWTQSIKEFPEAIFIWIFP